MSYCDLEHQLHDLFIIIISRCLENTQSSKIELHSFSDTSQYAMSSVRYVRLIKCKLIHTNISCAKTKIVPFKKMSIRRFEVTAAALLTKLSSSVRKALDLESARVLIVRFNGRVNMD